MYDVQKRVKSIQGLNDVYTGAFFVNVHCIPFQNTLLCAKLLSWILCFWRLKFSFVLSRERFKFLDNKIMLNIFKLHLILLLDLFMNKKNIRQNRARFRYFKTDLLWYRILFAHLSVFGFTPNFIQAEKYKTVCLCFK